MGLFDKKTCDVCGNKIGLMGNRKLEDGNLCKDCANKLSPWFTDRKKSTVAEIKNQLDYREQNKNLASSFVITRTIGEHTKLLIDDNNRKFTVASGSNPLTSNPDILDFSQAVSCELSIDESQHEKKENIDGEMRSYNPPRFEYSYNMHATIRVSGNPYFDEMSFSLSNGSINTGETRMQAGMVSSGWSMNSHSMSFGDNYEIRKYEECINIGTEMKNAVDGMKSVGGGMQQGMGMQANMQQGMQPNMQQGMGMQANMQQGMQQSGGFCPNCGAPVTGKFCTSCGSQIGN